MEYIVKKYINILAEENKRHNLVSRKSFAEEVDKHIEDSLAILQFVPLLNKKVIDIGSGAGFPALILAMQCPDSQFTLLESDLKKSNFLSHAAAELNLSNVEVVRARVEEMGQDIDYRQSFDICTSRAVAPLNVMLEYGLPLLRVGGLMWLWKGRNYLSELEDADKALTLLKGKFMQTYLYNLLEARDRAIVVIKKEEETPKEYPRKVGIPTKRPL